MRASKKPNTNGQNIYSIYIFILCTVYEIVMVCTVVTAFVNKFTSASSHRSKGT